MNMLDIGVIVFDMRIQTPGIGMVNNMLYIISCVSHITNVLRR